MQYVYQLLGFVILGGMLLTSSVANSQGQFGAADIANKAQEFVKENPNCTSAVIESLKKKSTMTCAEALKPNTKDKKKALQEKCESLKAELKSAQGSCVSK